MIEVFQNIVRHSQNESNFDFFSVRSLDEGVHIFSSNSVDAPTKKFLNKNLEKINSLSSEELNQLYKEILYNGQVSNKGGAGLGLVQMARKSKNSIQYHFGKIDNNSSIFSYQIDLSTHKNLNLDQFNNVKIEENLEIFSKFNEDKILLFYKGNFSKSNINSLLYLLKANKPQESNEKNFDNYRIFHTGVELIQNVSRHGKSRNNFLEGVLCIFETKNGYYMGTGNYLKSGDFTRVENHLNKINNVPTKELKKVYLETLKESSKNNDNNAGVGLIDVRRYNESKIDYEIQNHDLGLFLLIGVSLSTNN